MDTSFWRKRAYHYREVAEYWRAIALILLGVLAGITFITFWNLLST
jgi:hypothetical protein